MEAPKTWLSAIVRPDAVYIQAYIFSCDNGYIANSHIVLTNKENNESTIYQMASGDETCLFKYINKLTPDVSTNYSIQLVVNAYIYSESDIITFLDTVEFTTPDSWREDVGGDYAVTIEPIVAVGNLSTKPTVRSVISGGEFKDGMRLRICAANSLSTTLDYNSSDAMADFALEDGIYVYNNIFGLGVSGKWYFKAFLALQNNNIISTSNTFEYNVNQGDIEIENLIVGDNVSVVETGTPYVSNQVVNGLGTIGFFSIVDNNSLQIGDTYVIHDNPVEMNLDQYINGNNSFRVATMQEIENYSQLCNFGAIYTGSNHKTHVVSSEKNEYGYKAWDIGQNQNGEYGLNHPTTINGVDPIYAMLLLTPFENRLAAPGSLDIVALKGGNKIQGTGYKTTDFVKKSELDMLTRRYLKSQEVEFSMSENVENKKIIEDCEEIRLTLYRNIDGAVVRNVSASVSNNGYISLLHMFPHDTEIVGIEYSVRYQLIDDINIGTYYETWINEVNTYGTAIASEFTLTINTI